MRHGPYNYSNSFEYLQDKVLHTSGSGGNMEHPGNQFRGNLDIEALADKLWEKIYNKPSIIPCPYCKSHNAVTNPTCVQCGGPLGG